ncbi:MAG: PAS domain-containing protein, partial [Oscillospiraceae bacterium]
MQLNSLNENDKYAFFNFEMQHEKQYAHYSAIGNTGWKLYTNVSKKEIFAPTKFLMKVIIAFFLFLAVIVVIISRYILKSYLKPIDALYKAILNASENGIFTKFEYDKNDEFGKISTAFNNMIKEKIVSTQKLLDANVEVQTIIENIPGGVYRCKLNEDLEFSFVSDGLLNLLDCEKNDITEIYDNKAINIVHQKDRLKIYKGLKYQEIHENMIEVECRLMRPDGSYVWVLNRSKMMINKNGEKLLYCVAVDITTSKAIQDELSQSRKQYRAILEQSEDIICEWNFIDDTASFSNFWFKKFGYYIPEDNFSKYVKKSNNIHPDDKEIFTEWLKNLRENTITN